MTTTTKTMTVVMIMMMMMIMIMTLATLIYPRQCIYWYQGLLCPSKYRKKLIQMKYNKIKNTQWCDRTTNWLCTCKYGRGVEFRSTEIKLQFMRGTWTSDLGLLIRYVRWPSWPRSLPPDTHLAVLVDRNRVQSCSERHSFLEQQVCLPWTL